MLADYLDLVGSLQAPKRKKTQVSQVATIVTGSKYGGTHLWANVRAVCVPTSLMTVFALAVAPDGGFKMVLGRSASDVDG